MLFSSRIHRVNNNNNGNEIYQRKWYKDGVENIVLNNKKMYNSEYVKHIYYDKKKRLYYKEKGLYFDKRKSKWYKVKEKDVLIDKDPKSVQQIDNSIRDNNVGNRLKIKQLVIEYKRRVYNKIIKESYSRQVNIKLIEILNIELNRIENNVKELTEKLEWKDGRHCCEYFNKLMIIIMKQIEQKFNHKDK
jgi:hypothetical protein